MQTTRPTLIASVNMKSLSKAFVTISVIAGIAFGFDQEHTSLTELLNDHVKSNGVNYKGIKKDYKKLTHYLRDLEKVSSEKFETWSEEEQLSYLINLYNAATLDLVIQHYPIKSFKDEAGGENGPWKYRFVKALGKTYTLDEIEHSLIRANYDEPRIHFAVNCASEGCPTLRNEAFTASHLDDQLQEQAENFLNDSSKNHYKNGTLYLSSIFDWFKQDFIDDKGSVEQFVTPFFSEKIQKGKTPIKYTNYSWKLNEQ